MKKLFSLTALVAVALLFGGCPYSADIPIDNPSVKIDPRMPGTWKESSDEDSKYIITSKDDYTIAIEEKKKGSESTFYNCYASNVGGATFLNLWNQTDEADSRTYYFYKLTFTNDDMITLQEVTENIDETFGTGDALKKFIADNMHNSYFYSKDEQTFSRVKN